MTDSSLVILEHQDHISTLTINRPDKLNSLNPTVLEQLEAALVEISNKPQTRCVILTGTGKAFVAGADIEAMRDMASKDAVNFAEKGQAVFEKIETLRCPVIAAVNGFALGGGCELALACDFIYASEKAKFGQPEVKLGIIPGFGGTQRLSRRVGVARSREIIYTGDILSAEEAKSIGLVNQVCSPEILLDEVKKVAIKIAAVGPIAVSKSKQAILNGEDESLTKANKIEVKAFSECFGTQDQREGMSAFIEKRAPLFTGK